MFASKSFSFEAMQQIKELERNVTELEQRNKQNYDCLIELNYDYGVLSQQFNSLPDNIKKSHFCVDEKLELKTRLSKVDLIIDSEADKNRISELEKKLQNVQSELAPAKICVTREDRTEFGNSSSKIKLLEEELKKVKANFEKEKRCLLNSIGALERRLQEAHVKKESASNVNLSSTSISDPEKTQLLSKIAMYEKQIKQCVDVKLYETAKSQIVSLKEACLKQKQIFDNEVKEMMKKFSELEKQATEAVNSEQIKTAELQVECEIRRKSYQDEVTDLMEKFDSLKQKLKEQRAEFDTDIKAQVAKSVQDKSNLLRTISTLEKKNTDLLATIEKTKAEKPSELVNAFQKKIHFLEDEMAQMVITQAENARKGKAAMKFPESNVKKQSSKSSNSVHSDNYTDNKFSDDCTGFPGMTELKTRYLKQIHFGRRAQETKSYPARRRPSNVAFNIHTATQVYNINDFISPIFQRKEKNNFHDNSVRRKLFDTPKSDLSYDRNWTFTPNKGPESKWVPKSEEKIEVQIEENKEKEVEFQEGRVEVQIAKSKITEEKSEIHIPKAEGINPIWNSTGINHIRTQVESLFKKLMFDDDDEPVDEVIDLKGK